MDFGKATTFAVSLKDPYLEDMAVNLLKEIGYFGIAEVEFMRDDKDGLYKLLEINGRPWGWHTLLKASGINLPYMLFQLMIFLLFSGRLSQEGWPSGTMFFP